MPPPVFIIGNPRSGTTLLRLIVNNHQKIGIPPECGFALWLEEKYESWSDRDGRSLLRIKEFIEDLRICKKIETWKLNYSRLEMYLAGACLDCYAGLVEKIYQFYAAENGRDISLWGDKNNYYITHVDRIIALFPDALFIHIVRDGRDVACSYQELSKNLPTSIYAPKLPVAIEKIAEEWKSNNQSALDIFKLIDPSRVLRIRYEDLVSDTPRQCQIICSFLGQDYDAGMLMYYQSNKEKEQEPIEFLEWKKKTLEKPSTSEIGKYKLNLTQQEIKAFNHIAGDLLQVFGYEV